MIDLAATRDKLIRAASQFEGKICNLSDSFFRNPETGFEEFKTSSAMQAFLRDAGFAISANIAGMPTAFRASIGSGGPVVALLAEMDALPGIGHACGHNIGGMCSAGAGAVFSTVLKEELDKGNGTLVVLGTPAEEFGRGKIDMIKAGVFKDIDAAMMVHGSSRRTVFKQFLGLLRLDLTFYGRSSHASAYPEEGVNALDAVIQTFNSINALRQQLSRDVRVHGIITEGGKAPNIIPDRTAAKFYVRAQDIKGLEAVRQKVINCAEGAALATGCSLDVGEVGDINHPMRVNNAFLDAYRRAIEFLGLPEDPQPPLSGAGSSDVGNVSQAIPAIHPYVPIMSGINIHTREFAEATITQDGHRALMEGVKTLGLTALELFFVPLTLQKIKKEFDGG